MYMKPIMHTMVLLLIYRIYNHRIKCPKGRSMVLQTGSSWKNWHFFGWSSKQSRNCPHSYSTPLVLPVDHTMQFAQVESLASRRSWVDRSGCLCLAQKLVAQAELLVFRKWYYVQECTAVTAKMIVYYGVLAVLPQTIHLKQTMHINVS